LAGRAGRNEHLLGKYRPIDKKLKSDAIGNGNHFPQQCNKWKSTSISQANHANEWLAVFLRKAATANRLSN
jgi:hypothetical protein